MADETPTPLPVALPRPVAAFTGATPSSAPKPDAERLAEMLPIWKRERRPNDKTEHAYTRAVEEFDALHRSPALKAITRTMVVMYRDKLQESGKSVVTVNGRMAFLRALLGVAKGRGIITANAAEETTLPAAKRAVEARMPYSPAQADVVMAGTAVYKDTHPARYWLPRLARWTGARLNELHQLRRMDVVECDGIRGISITDHGECMPGLAMRLKNAGSRRWVPLHSGVAEFWTWAKGQPDGALFPADANKFGVISDALSKWYGRALRGPWRIADDRITFHSWRHAFAGMCRAVGVPPDVRMALMGHSEGGAAGTYGAGQMAPAALDAAIQRLPTASRHS
ncbi:site-specific integrase [Pseudorhodoferax sp. Leaf274]|uniref:site-specific integrase n=1 Tax=Pseudorhodoferax sp. Leaf274 TaxID=1736318 RepID=UPI0012E2CEDB|nr:site-specific integrase [Pseudorhodoferax sp. Leaf274]